MAQNLLKNPNAQEGLDFWHLTENGGDKWRVEDLPGHSGYELPCVIATKYFVTSHSEYGGRNDCGCTYEITVCLLDKNKKELQVFKPDPVTLDPESECGCSWRQMNHVFFRYGPGLRFISFQHGGQSTKGWKGWYGVRVTGSSVTLVQANTLVDT
ncbi:hypothetical protein CRUP_005205 [Coryphaenoides rupestris]|nr:hypothetical protein CRUP_005205 [Coryphaenoides rupestris]